MRDMTQASAKVTASGATWWHTLGPGIGGQRSSGALAGLLRHAGCWGGMSGEVFSLYKIR